MRWLISVPVWGEPYIRIFLDLALPALKAAVDRLPRTDSVRFVIHTNRPEAMYEALQGYAVEAIKIEGKTTYVTLQESHLDALNRAREGECVVFLNADLVISGNLLEKCGQHIEAGYKAIVLLGIRTRLGSARPPVNASPRELLLWAWYHRHQIIKDLEWHRGQSLLPTNLFFLSNDEKNVVARGFHLHPVAVVKQPGLSFESTIDGDLLNWYPTEDIHVVTDPDDCSMLELSPPDRRFPIRAGGLTPERVAGSMRTRVSKRHMWLFSKRIIVMGDGEGCNDVEISKAIMDRLGPLYDRLPEPKRGFDSTGKRGRTPAQAT